MPLRADRFDVACFALVIARGAGPRRRAAARAVARRCAAIVAAAALWSSGFALFAVRYAPILIRPRRDGKPG